MDGLLSLKWSNHQSTFIHTLRSLRNKELYTDATLACDGKFYSVHKLVLSTCSDYFSAMLDRTNCKNPVIVLKDIKCEDLEALLDYMYLGEVNVKQCDLSTLIKAAECLHVKGLAVPDDECQPRKNKRTDNLYKSEDVSGSPLAKKRRSDDDQDDSLSRQESRPSVVHSSFSKHKRRCQVSLSPLRSSTAAQDEASHKENLSNGNDHIEDVQIEQAESLVKIEMDDSENAIEEYNCNNEGGLKEEPNKREIAEAGDDRADISSDLPDYMQQASTEPPQDTFEHSSFSDSNFQSSDIHGWQSDGSNIAFPLLDIGSAEPGQQKASIMCNEELEDLRNSTPPSQHFKYLQPFNTNSLALTSCSSSLSTSAPTGSGYFSRSDESVHNNHQYLLSLLKEVPNQRPSHLATKLCTICGKKFISSRDLLRHTRTHTGEKPFHCPACPYRSTIKSHMKKHMFSQHQLNIADFPIDKLPG